MSRTLLPDKRYGKVWIKHPKTKKDFLQCYAKNYVWYLLGSKSNLEKLEVGTTVWIQTERQQEKIMLAVQEKKDEYTKYEKWYPPDSGLICIGRSEKCQIICESPLISTIHGILTWQQGGWSYEDQQSKNGSWLNGTYVRKAALSIGDILFFMDRIVIVSNEFIVVNQGKIHGLQIWSKSKNYGKYSFVQEPTYYFYPNFIVVKSWERLERSLERPPALQKEMEQPQILTLGPSFTMGLAAIFSGSIHVWNGILQKVSLLSLLPNLIMTVSMAVSMLLWPFFNQVYQNKQREQREEKRKEIYLAYLEQQRKKWNLALEEESSWRRKIFPVDLETILLENKQVWSRIFQESADVRVPLGIGDVDLGMADVPKRKFQIEKDWLEEKMREMSEEKWKLHQVPILLDRKQNQKVTFQGASYSLRTYCQGLVLWCAAMIPPSKLQILLFLNEESLQSWKDLRWLEHIFGGERRFLATRESEWRQLEQYYFRERKEKISYLAIFDCGRAAESFFQSVEDKESIWLWYLGVELPETNLLVSLQSSNLYYQKDSRQIQVSVPFWVDAKLRDKILRHLNQLHDSKMQRMGRFPEQVTFLDLFQVHRVEELDVLSRWQQAKSFESLEAPVGMNERGCVWKLDLHENCHGPHMLTAGMTGSGKSEFLMTFILSLAVCYSPEDVTVVIIDYKGGGLADIFYNPVAGVRLPHLAGVLTNLDTSSVQRVIFAIQSELTRRQKLFAKAGKRQKNGVMNIDRYQRLCREQKTITRIPHLFLIVDEFAELKTGHPEFLEQLISSARIGRSLGIHLILATQKPSGVVNEQIWSNSRTKVCLKVQDKLDSQEILHRPEAAFLRNVGRFYVQCGYNELFEEVQSAWTGADYIPEECDCCQVSVIDWMGKVQSKVDRQSARSEQTQALAVLELLEREAEQLPFYAAFLWQAPLGESRWIQDLKREYTLPKDLQVKILLGEYDNPRKQCKEGLWFYPESSGNILISGGSRKERQKFLQLILQGLTDTYSKQKLKVYGIQMDRMEENQKFSLSENSKILRGDEKTEIQKLFRQMKQELEMRRYGSAELPLLWMFIDNLNVFQENFECVFGELCQLAREGQEYNIKMIFLNTRPSEVRFRLQQSLAQIYLFWMPDRNEYSVISDGAGVEPEHIFGRGIFKKDRVYEFQMGKGGKYDWN